MASGGSNGSGGAQGGGEPGSAADAQTLSELEIRQQFTHGLLSLLEPTVRQIDDRVTQVRLSQIELRAQIDSVAELLCAITDEKSAPVDLEAYVKKLNNAKRRVMLVNNIIQNAQERLGRLHASIQKEQARLNTEVDDPHPYYYWLTVDRPGYSAAKGGPLAALMRSLSEHMRGPIRRVVKNDLQVLETDADALSLQSSDRIEVWLLGSGLPTRAVTLGAYARFGREGRRWRLDALRKMREDRRRRRPHF
uniref:Biogenesis of lysosome-related organelles complex 1 subunit 7 n=1 Tax=Macrostomum lignano TaxID=282301 RepID=A0A1I8J448_9PLAT